MTEEPYRWLEAIANRREYVLDQIKDGSPVFAVSLREGILILGVGPGNSKVFEIHDRHAMAALGHPADLERIRQSAIDMAHVEAFTRAAEDVSLRRLVGFGLAPQLKLSFEQVFAAPVLGEFIFVELGSTPETDILARLRFDGIYTIQSGRVAVATGTPEKEPLVLNWITQCLNECHAIEDVSTVLLKAWTSLANHSPFPQSTLPTVVWRMENSAALKGLGVEAALLVRDTSRSARYRPIQSF